jgi:hypothetical protein
MRLIANLSQRIARRSQWLARRLWLVAAFEIALLTRSHWRRLEPEERRRLAQLLRKSRGRPSRLSAREREEAADLLEKLNYAELGGSVAGTLLPFRPLARVIRFGLGRPARSRQRRARAARA